MSKDAARPEPIQPVKIINIYCSECQYALSRDFTNLIDTAAKMADELGVTLDYLVKDAEYQNIARMHWNA